VLICIGCGGEWLHVFYSWVIYLPSAVQNYGPRAGSARHTNEAREYIQSQVITDVRDIRISYDISSGKLSLFIK